jgi:hypothetical protein
MSSTMKRTGTAMVLGAALLLPVAAAGPAAADNDRRLVTRTASCGGGVTYELKAKVDDGRLEVEYEVDSNRVGQTWAVRVTDNGAVVYSGQRRTVAPSGSFSVERLIANKRGTDVITAKAVRGAQTCSGTIRF